MSVKGRFYVAELLKGTDIHIQVQPGFLNTNVVIELVFLTELSSLIKPDREPAYCQSELTELSPNIYSAELFSLTENLADIIQGSIDLTFTSRLIIVTFGDLSSCKSRHQRIQKPPRYCCY